MKIWKIIPVTLVALVLESCASNSSHRDTRSSKTQSSATAVSCYDKAKEQETLGNNRMAIEYNSKAIDINPYFYDAYINRGVLYYKQGEYQKAFKDFSFVLKYKKDAVCLFDRGNIYYSWKMYNEAITDFSEAVHVNQQDSDSYTMLGNCYAQKKQYNDAIVSYKKAISINPSDTQAYNNLKALQGR